MIDKNITTRRDIIEKAVIDCLNEMYVKSQPSITWEEIQKQAKENPNRSIWQEHYLPKWLYDDILFKYKNMYRIGDEWTGNIELLEKYLNEGGNRDKYMPEVIEENGFRHPPYRSYEKVAPIKVQIESILNTEFISGEVSPFVKDAIRDKIVETVMNTISDCKEYYVHNREELGFNFEVMNYSPNSNIEAVREFYEGTDVIIEKVKEYDDEDYDNE